MASPQRTLEFRAEAVRIALTSGLPRKQVSSDLGVHCPAGDLQGKSAERGIFDAEPLDTGRPAQSREAVGADGYGA